MTFHTGKYVYVLMRDKGVDVVTCLLMVILFMSIP